MKISVHTSCIHEQSFDTSLQNELNEWWFFKRWTQKEKTSLPFPSFPSRKCYVKDKKYMSRNEQNLSYFGEAWDEQLDFDILLSLFWAILEHSHQAYFNVSLILSQIIVKNFSGDNISKYKNRTIWCLNYRVWFISWYRIYIF